MAHIIPISADILYSRPEADEKRAEEELRKERQGFNRKIIVLDDDPTGTQTVHDIPVYTDWSLETIEEIFQIPDDMVFILTNSRSFSRAYTKEVHKKIAENIACAAKRAKKAGRLYAAGTFSTGNRTIKRCFKPKDRSEFSWRNYLSVFSRGRTIYHKQHSLCPRRGTAASCRTDGICKR